MSRVFKQPWGSGEHGKKIAFGFLLFRKHFGPDSPEFLRRKDRLIFELALDPRSTNEQVYNGMVALSIHYKNQHMPKNGRYHAFFSYGSS
jgi:hypothetical protein